MNIYQKLLEVRKAVPYLQKADKGHQYNYTGSGTVLAALRVKLDEVGLILEPRVTGKTVHILNEGKTIFTEVDIEMTWVNVEKPEEKIVCPWYAQGFDNSGEKGVGKAYTYAEKYFLLKYFNIPTDKDDPDAFQSKHDNVTPLPTKSGPEAPASNDERRKLVDDMKKAGLKTQPMWFDFMDATIGHHDTTNLTKGDFNTLTKALPVYMKELAAANA